MEEKKLDFEKKLLSARHLTSEAAPENGSKWRIEDSVRSMRRPPPYKSELKSGPVSNPGTVPFKWEHIPGRPKDDKTRSNLHVAESYKVPKLPPGRTVSVGQQDHDKASANPVVQKDLSRGLPHESWNLQCADENVKPSRSFRDEENGVENCSSGNEEEKFVDALETFSRAESSLINCSLSGLSGMEDSGTKVYIDSQTRDFMMGRFLPAAKAMASETPQHAPRKPPIVRQEWTQLGKMVHEDKKPQLRYGPDFALESLEHNGNGDEESDVESDEGENFSGKVCGFLPGFVFRTSFCFLNPLPGINMRSSAPVSPLRKSQTKTSSWACSEADLKIKSLGLEISKHKTTRKALENNDIPIPYLSLDDVDSPLFSEAMAEENQSKNMGIEGQVADKTLYVDTEHVRSLHVKSSASDTNGQTELQVKRHESLAEKDQNQLLDASPIDTEKLDLTKRGVKSETQFQMPDFHIVMQKSSRKEQDIFKGSNMPEDEFSMLCTTGPRKSESKVYSELPAPPPLPKSPADSWLGRTLHSISTKNSSVHSYRGTWRTSKDQENKPKSLDPKWETMVRMRKMQDKHSFFSEDRLTPIPEA